MLVTLIVINKEPERAGQGPPDTAASIPRGVRGEQNKNTCVVGKFAPHSNVFLKSFFTQSLFLS